MSSPRYYRAVYYDGSNNVELTNVLTLSVDIGRRSILDTIQPGRASFTYRRMNGSTPLPQIGDPVYLVDWTSGTTGAQIIDDNDWLFSGFVQDVAIDWDVVSAGDAITVTLEGPLGAYGRNVQEYSFPHDNLSDYVTTINAVFGVTVNLFNAGSDIDIHAVNWNDSCADLLRKLATTTYGRIVEMNNQVALLAGNYTQTANWKFTDSPSGTYQVYESIRYESLADNYYTRVAVDYPGSSEVVGSGYRNLTVDTLSRNATNATSLATYYANTFSSPVMGLAEISALASAQPTFRLSKLADFSTFHDGVYNCVGTQMQVEFRGANLTVVVEGVSISGNAADSRYTFYVSPADLNSYLVLDNTYLGRLDYNKLGF